MPAHPSEGKISDSEGDASKVETQKRRYSIYTHFPEDRNCDKCVRKNYEGSVQKTHWRSSTLEQKKFGDLITADHKVLSESCES